jgi:7,8-dihydro-6-hydroxymethylpterin-pyrophosphokinase
MNTDKLVIPHPGLEYRDFVLMPLYEITSYRFEIPKYGKIITLIKNLS